ncbi:VWA domain-containing protein [candidate division KSB1 bacterium]|nr:MAG: VWA domain-containing protein [candidate division KSB1 bacterium]MCE7940443.1 VWA domain-containing protein [Chlorobi bacterium CHB1]MDL1873637.1 VWA domain-containing protein [Cytophagia bacterium CHB2]
MTFDLKFAAPAFYPLILLALGVAFTLFVYRTTTPRVSNLLRRVLAILRTVALAAALLLLFEPTLSLAVKQSQKPAVAILVDRSASMTLSDSTQSRADLAKQALSRPWLAQLREQAEVFLYSFGDTLQALALDSIAALKFDGDGSNLANALTAAKQQLAHREYRGAIVFSDGAYNIGSNPGRVAESYGLPIITTQIGARRDARDALISEVVTNEVAYADTKLPVAISVSASGLAGRQARLRVYEGENEVATQTLVLPSDNTQVTASVSLLPQQVGLTRYTVSLDHFEGELTTENNRRAFYVKVLKSKLTIWIFAGAPSADFAFLQRTIAHDPNFQVRGFVQRSGGSFYADATQALPAFRRPDEWQPVDAVLLVDFPRRDSDRSLLDMLVKQLGENAKPLFYLHGPGVDLNMLGQLRGVLPLAALPNAMSEQIISVQFTPAGLSHPVTRAITDRLAKSANGRATALSTDELPPLFSNVYSLKPSPNAETLAGAGSRMESLWLAQKNANRKTIAIFTYGIWRWKSLLEAVGKNTETYESMMTGLVRWLVTKEDAKLVRFESNKEIYRGGEQIELMAQVYHEDYRPYEGAQVKAQLTGPQFNQEIILQDAGSGLYRARLQVLGGGEYLYKGTAVAGDRTLGEDSGRFSVEPFSLEFLDTRYNEPVLRQMAQLTGGAYVASDSLGDYLSRLPLQPTTKVESYHLALWGRPSVLVILLLTLGLEWFIRRRQGML